MKTLYSWVGHADLKSFSNNKQGIQYRERVQRIIGKEKALADSPGLGPIETVIHDFQYGRIVL